jgi:hypothetical protein
LLDAYFRPAKPNPLVLLAPPRQAGAAAAGTHTTPGVGNIATAMEQTGGGGPGRHSRRRQQCRRGTLRDVLLGQIPSADDYDNVPKFVTQSGLIQWNSATTLPVVHFETALAELDTLTTIWHLQNEA